MTKAVKLARAVGVGGVLEDGEIQAAQVTGLATVASTNSYTDLINKPTIPSITGLASETYVNTQINNLINSAPSTLDTLKEIADQLAIDQSAVSALTTLVNSKAATASLATVATTGSYTDLTNKPAGGTTYLKKTANYTAADRDGIIADTSAGTFTVFLPATPTLGMQVAIVDGNNWGTNNLTVGRNGSTIEGLSENLVLDIAGVSVQLIYDGTTWEVFAQAGVLGVNTVPASSVSGLATVATTGSYADLTNKPTLFSGSYTDLTSKPTLFSGSYVDLTNKPTLFSGSYTDLTNQPTIPTNNNQLTNGAGYITSTGIPAQTGNTGKFLTTNGTATSWATVDALPAQTSNSGKYLTTDGTTASWATVATGGGAVALNSATISANYSIPTGSNGFTVGPVIVANGVSVSIASGQRWVII